MRKRMMSIFGHGWDQLEQRKAGVMSSRGCRHDKDEREDMTKEEFAQMRRDLDDHLNAVERRFWEYVRITPYKAQTPPHSVKE